MSNRYSFDSIYREKKCEYEKNKAPPEMSEHDKFLQCYDTARKDLLIRTQDKNDGMFENFINKKPYSNDLIHKCNDKFPQYYDEMLLKLNTEFSFLHFKKHIYKDMFDISTLFSPGYKGVAFCPKKDKWCYNL